MNNLRIRPATIEDYDTLRHFYYEFHEFHARGVPGYLRSLGEFDKYDWATFRKSIDSIFANSGAAIYLAEYEGSAVGFVEVYIKDDDRNNLAIVPYHYGYVQSLFVLQSHRQHGIGKQLMGAAEQWARDQGATVMHLTAWEFAAGPLQFYEKSGYRTLQRTFTKDL